MFSRIEINFLKMIPLWSKGIRAEFIFFFVLFLKRNKDFCNLFSFNWMVGNITSWKFHPHKRTFEIFIACQTHKKKCRLFNNQEYIRAEGKKWQQHDNGHREKTAQFVYYTIRISENREKWQRTGEQRMGKDPNNLFVACHIISIDYFSRKHFMC